MSGRQVRETWLEHVLFTPQLADGVRRVLVALALGQDGRGPWMNDKGRVRPVKHKDVGAALCLSGKTVANRIADATTKGLLVKDPTTGYRGRAAAYQIQLPPRTTAIEGPSSLRALVGGYLQVPGIEEPSAPVMREPFPPLDPLKVPLMREAQRARAHTRVPKNNREQEPAPDASREEREHDVTSQAGTYGSWMPTRLNQPSSDSTENVA